MRDSCHDAWLETIVLVSRVRRQTYIRERARTKRRRRRNEQILETKYAMFISTHFSDKRNLVQFRDDGNLLPAFGGRAGTIGKPAIVFVAACAHARISFSFIFLASWVRV